MKKIYITPQFCVANVELSGSVLQSVSVNSDVTVSDTDGGFSRETTWEEDKNFWSVD